MMNLETKVNLKSKSKEETMKKLMAAGLEVFAKEGFDGSSTKMVSEKAGVNEALINRYFDGKRGLLRAIVVNYIQEIMAEAAHYPAGECVESEILSFMRARLSPCKMNLSFVRLSISQALVDADLRKEMTQKIQHPAETVLLERLKAFQKSGDLSAKADLPGLVELLHYVMSGILFETAVEKIRDISEVDAKLKKIAKNMASCE